MLNDLSTKNIVPDLTLLLDASVKTGNERNTKAGSFNRLDLESKEFHQKVRDSYLKMYKEDKGKRWVLFDAEKTVREVEKDIWKVVSEKLKL
jgi:dTMP kinase